MNAEKEKAKACPMSMSGHSLRAPGGGRQNCLATGCAWWIATDNYNGYCVVTTLPDVAEALGITREGPQA